MPAITTETYAIQPDLEDRFLYSGKLRPQLYLDPRVRAGMSSFASFPDAAEIERGVSRLADDIASGRIAQVIAKAQHDDGDYLFICAERRA